MPFFFSFPPPVRHGRDCVSLEDGIGVVYVCMSQRKVSVDGGGVVLSLDVFEKLSGR